ncbi:MAG TPA: DUF475 domain-containing protein [Pararhizobium sp.]|nr:DUF475 domain-containing protein [Pararhizobium sp.]
MATHRYFVVAALFTIIGLSLGTWIGYFYKGTLDGALEALFICGFLSVLEISLSFDNAIVNAKVLDTMAPKWQRRFLTWGIVVAVFGMRIIFPLAIVAVAAHLNPVQALLMAAERPAAYAHAMEEAHLPISAFGGAFLLMVALKFFFDSEKDVHWLAPFERSLSHFGKVQGIQIGIVLLFILISAWFLPDAKWVTFVRPAIWGLITFLAVEALSHLLDKPQAADTMHKAGFGAFLYLEMLDASFSFDGVVGAFALSSNLFIIAIGLGIGAFYIRSLTIMLVEKRTLTEYRYLEHGAFYAILALGLIMFAQAHVHIPEVVTGLIGAVLIVASFASSIAFNRRKKQHADADI